MPYLSASEVCSRRGAIQIHVYTLLPTPFVPRYATLLMTNEERSSVVTVATLEGHSAGCFMLFNVVFC